MRYEVCVALLTYIIHSHHSFTSQVYMCLSHDGEYCKEWEGTIDGEEEFEYAQCECEERFASVPACKTWSCREKGMNYFFPNLFWSLLCVIFGIPPTILIYASTFGEDVPLWFAITAYTIWTGGWTILCVWLGGLNVLVITLAVHFGPLLLGLLLSGKCSECISRLCSSCGECIQCCSSISCPSVPTLFSSSSSSSGKPSMPTYNYDGNGSIEMPNDSTFPVATAVVAG